MPCKFKVGDWVKVVRYIPAKDDDSITKELTILCLNRVGKIYRINDTKRQPYKYLIDFLDIGKPDLCFRAGELKKIPDKEAILYVL